MKDRTWLVVMGIFLYVAVATVAYRFGHQEMSETRLFLDIPKALIWSWQ